MFPSSLCSYCCCRCCYSAFPVLIVLQKLDFKGTSQILHCRFPQIWGLCPQVCEGPVALPGLCAVFHRCQHQPGCLVKGHVSGFTLRFVDKPVEYQAWETTLSAGGVSAILWWQTSRCLARQVFCLMPFHLWLLSFDLFYTPQRHPRSPFPLMLVKRPGADRT